MGVRVILLQVQTQSEQPHNAHFALWQLGLQCRQVFRRAVFVIAIPGSIFHQGSINSGKRF